MARNNKAPDIRCANELSPVTGRCIRIKLRNLGRFCFVIIALSVVQLHHTSN